MGFCFQPKVTKECFGCHCFCQNSSRLKPHKTMKQNWTWGVHIPCIHSCLSNFSKRTLSTGWWLGTWLDYDFPFSWEWNNPPNWRVVHHFSGGVETNHQPVHHFIPIPPAAQIASCCLAAKMAWTPAAGFQLSGGNRLGGTIHREPFGACFFTDKRRRGQKTSKLPILSGSTGSSTLFWSHRGRTLKCASAAFTWTHGHRRCGWHVRSRPILGEFKPGIRLQDITNRMNFNMKFYIEFFCSSPKKLWSLSTISWFLIYIYHFSSFLNHSPFWPSSQHHKFWSPTTPWQLLGSPRGCPLRVAVVPPVIHFLKEGIFHGNHQKAQFLLFMRRYDDEERERDDIYIYIIIYIYWLVVWNMNFICPYNWE